VFSKNTLGGYGSVASPVLTFVILVFSTGMLVNEKEDMKKFGKLPEFHEYRARTSPLIPMPPALYSNLPSFSKLVCFCEFPFYGRLDGGDSYGTVAAGPAAPPQSQLPPNEPSQAVSAVVVHISAADRGVIEP